MMRLLALLSILALAGCETNVLGHGCTEIGCGDALSLSFETADGHWPDGDYRVELEFAGESEVCTFKLPDALPTETAGAAQVCEPSPRGFFSPKSTCTETRTKDAVSESCTPLPDQWTLALYRDGTPETVSVRVTRDDQEVASLSQTVDYRENRPNGPDCEPVCRQSQIDVQVD